MNEKILDIIKKKVDEATMEELDEALQYLGREIYWHKRVEEFKEKFFEKEDICKCGHHTNDHSHPYPANLDNDDLECDICDCNKFVLKGLSE